MEQVLDGKMIESLGADRVVEPGGALPQPAWRLDPSAPVRPHEIEIAVERLCLDSTSHRDIRESAGGDPAAMSARILEIARERGKMHNPLTGSGGVLLGTVGSVGDACSDPPAPGDRIVSLASLSLTPLAIDEIVAIDPGSAQVEVRGTAYLPERAPWAPLPDDLPLDLALAVYDVYAAASHTRDLTPAGGTVCVLGAGHGGKVALAAARDADPNATLVAVDADHAAVELARDLGLCDIGVQADLSDPLDAAARVRVAGAGPADLSVHVVSAPGCEPAAIVLTAGDGTLLLYSMATSFQTSALTADGMSSGVTMIIGNGFAADRGAYALDLVRRSAALRAALEAKL